MKTKRAGSVLAVITCVLFLGAPLRTPAEVSSSSFEGLWSGAVLLDPEENEIRLDVRLRQSEEGWEGTISIPNNELEDYPLTNIEVQSQTISFEFVDEGGVRKFGGDLGSEGRTIRGHYRRESRSFPMELDLRPEELWVENPELHVLEDRQPLRDQFNQARQKVRALMVLSPSCPRCLANAGMAQRYVLNPTSSDDIRLYLVWSPILDEDSAELAGEVSQWVKDARARHFWDPEAVLAEGYAGPLGIDGLAWDLMLVFPPGETWGDDLPSPAFFMHSNSHLPEQYRFDFSELKDRVDDLLSPASPSAPVGSPHS